MKEIWKKFLEDSKVALKNTGSSLVDIFADFLGDLKDMAIKGLELLENLILNIVKAIATIVEEALYDIFVGFFAAIYSSMEYVFTKIIEWIKASTMKK